jgi:hypothetical protein
VLHLLLALALVGQEPQAAPPPPAPDTAAGALRVYLDCGMCDLDFLHTEISFVDWVRDRHDAQVYLLVTNQGTAAGGTAYTLTLIGQEKFEGRADTLRYDARPDASDDDVRRGLAHLMGLGLARYVAQTPQAAEVELRRRPLPPGQVGGPGTGVQPRDPWNYWVFSLNTSVDLEGQESYRYNSFYYLVSANRVTDQWKLSFNLSQNRYTNKSQITDTSWYTNRQNSLYYTGLVVRSLGPHWSAGIKTAVNSSTSYNRDWRVQAGPAIEYDVWPYSQSTRRILRINYSLGVEHDKYDTVTVYKRTAENLATHSLEIYLASIQPWGTLSLDLTGNQYLRDLRLWDYNVFGGVSLHVVRGLSLGGYFSYSWIQDQLYLRAAQATPYQILTHTVQLPTSYSYYTYFSLTYTFGSIHNNVVNPRFGSSGGGGNSIYISF